jgi:cytochrome P450
MYSSANGIFPREARADHYLDVDGVKFKIKKGTMICPQTVPTHYSESLYNDPNKFNPERFLDGEGKLKTPEPYTWMNFSAGARGCVGRLLAMTEMKTALTTLMTSYDLKIKDEGKRLKFIGFGVQLENVKFYLKALK